MYTVLYFSIASFSPNVRRFHNFPPKVQENWHSPTLHSDKPLDKKINEFAETDSKLILNFPKQAAENLSLSTLRSGKSLNLSERSVDKWKINRRSENETRMKNLRSSKKENCVFFVMADLQYDIYHLYANKKNNFTLQDAENLCSPTLRSGEFLDSKEHYDIAYIPAHATSVR